MSEVKEEKLKCNMKGRIKNNENKQKTEKNQINEKEKKNMQVLKDSKVKFVSAVGVHLLTSFWICLRFSHSSRSYCLTFFFKFIYVYFIF